MKVRRPGDKHGYGNYTLGCRCAVCREAKAAYMRERRAEARRLARQHTSGRAGEPGSFRHVADVTRHGTNYAYYERGCRCRPCTDYSTALNASLPSRRAS